MASLCPLEVEHLLGFRSDSSLLAPLSLPFPETGERAILSAVGARGVWSSVEDPHNQKVLESGDSSPLVALTVSPTSSHAVLCHRSGLVVLYDLRPPVQTPGLHPQTTSRAIQEAEGCVQGVAWSPDARFVGVATPSALWVFEVVQTDGLVLAGGARWPQGAVEGVDAVMWAEDALGGGVGDRRRSYTLVVCIPSQVLIGQWQWDVRTMQFQLSLSPCAVPGAGRGPGRNRRYTCLSLSPSGDWAATGTHSGEFTVFSVRSAVMRSTVLVSTGGLRSLMPWDHAGHEWICGSGSGHLHHVRSSTSDLSHWTVEEIMDLGAPITAIAKEADGTLLATLSSGRIVVVNLADRSYKVQTEGLTSALTTLAFPEGGWASDKFVVGTVDGEVSLWDLSDYSVQLTSKRSGACVHALVYSGEEMVVVGWGDGQVSAHSAVTGEQVWVVPQAHRGAVRSLAYSSREQFMVSAGDDGVIRLWGVTTTSLPPQFGHQFPSFSGAPLSLLLDSRCPGILHAVGGGERERERETGCGEKVVVTWDLRSGPPRRLAIRQDSERHGYWTSVTQVPAPPTPTPTSNSSASNTPAAAGAAGGGGGGGGSSDGELLIGTSTGHLVVWDLDYEAPKMRVKLADGVGVTAVSITSTGTRVAVAFSDGRVRVYSYPSLQPLADPQRAAHATAVRTVSWSPDSRQLLSAGAEVEGAVCVWNWYEE